MKNVSRIALSVLAFLFFASALGILPTSANARAAKQGQQPSAQAQTVSGKIASVDMSSFTLNVASGGNAKSQHSMTNEASGPKTMTFQIDKNTTVDGQLQVGANADVTYRQESGNNIAISVHVS